MKNLLNDPPTESGYYWLLLKDYPKDTLNKLDIAYISTNVGETNSIFLYLLHGVDYTYSVGMEAKKILTFNNDRSLLEAAMYESVVNLNKEEVDKLTSEYETNKKKKRLDSLKEEVDKLQKELYPEKESPEAIHE